MFRSIMYKIIRGVLSAAAAAGMVMLTASPLGWIAVPIIGAIGKAVRVKLVKSGREDLEKFIVF